MIRSKWKYLLIVLIAFVFGYQFLCSFRSLRYLMQHVFVVDHAFYYFEIARNIADYGWATFDRIHSTSGVELLWTGILSALAFLIEDKILFLRGVFVLSAALNAFSAFLFYRIGSVLQDQKAGVLAALIWCGFVIRHHPTNMGTEYPLHMVIILAILYFFCENRRSYWILAILLILNFWTRMDSIFYSFFIVMIAALFFYRTRSSWKPGIMISAVFVTGVVLYCLLSQYLNGTWIPIPVLAKHFYASHFFDGVSPGVALQERVRWILANEGKLCFAILAPYQFIGVNFGPIQISLILLVLSMFSAYVVVVFRSRLTDPKAWRTACILLMLHILGILHMALVVFLFGINSKSTLHYYGWLYATFCLTIAISFSYLIPMLPNATVRRSIATMAICLFVYPHAWFIWSQAFQKDNLYINTMRMHAGNWIGRRLPMNARIGAWNAGVIGYFSERTVIDLDGMANDRGYLEFLRSGQPVQQYLQKEQIEYLCDTNVPDFYFRYRQKWNPSKLFHEAIPVEELTLLNTDQKIAIKVYLYRRHLAGL